MRGRSRQRGRVVHGRSPPLLHSVDAKLGGIKIGGRLAAWRRRGGGNLHNLVLQPEEEVIEADEEEAKAMAGFLGFMAGHGGRVPAII